MLKRQLILLCLSVTLILTACITDAATEAPPQMDEPTKLPPEEPEPTDEPASPAPPVGEPTVLISEILTASHLVFNKNTGCP